MEACRVSTLPDGSLLRTYAEHSASVSGGTGERLVAERVVGQVRVVASATNGFELPANDWDITRPDAVLSTEQLTAVVSQPWWGFELPGGVLRGAGRALVHGVLDVSHRVREVTAVRR